MALIKSTAIPSGATDYEIDQSLRFNNPDNPYLSRTFGTPTNRKIWTFSAWVKRSFNPDYPRIISTATGNDNINFMNDDTLRFQSDFGYLVTTMKFRDASAWYHIMYAFDSTQSTAANRLKLYVNGTQVTAFGTSDYPTLNDEVDFNSAIVHDIGRNAPEALEYMDGYLAELNWIDGQAKTPADFGETGTYGEWKPVEYSGTYGNNGFYLPFKQDYTVEGFSTVTYKGTGASQYVGGTGFKPDFTWIKMRDGTDEHRIMDSVRGIPFSSKTTTAAEDNDEVTGFTSRSTDGFSVGSAGPYNNSSNKFVAWNWDMGADTPTGFGCVTWTGNAVDNREISGVGFQPDLVWLKSRSDADHHYIQDSVRGAQKQLTVNDTTAESSYTNGVKSFTTDGFTLGTSNWAGENNQTRVAWCWNMGGSNASNTTGGINSTVRANTTYGQSIVSFTGTGSSATVGHGLNSAPEVVIVMNRAIAHNPSMWHTSIPNTHYLHLDGTAASAQNTAYWSSTSPTNQVFTVGTSADVNGSSNNMIAYCFHSVSGYSKFGTYNGTGSANNAITLGFRPAFLMVKRINSTEDWFIFDSTRNPLNTVNLRLKANTTDADGAYSYVNFTDTGFSWQATGTGQNGSGDSYIYMAFAGGMDSISDYNTDGSIDSRVKASTTYGQSIVTAKMPSSGTGVSMGHGLNSKPDMIILKSRSETAPWYVWHKDLASETQSYLKLNEPDSYTGNTSVWNNTAPTSSVFSTISNYSIGNSKEAIAYCFHSVTGYSTIGSFTGNGDSRSTAITINCGFKPAFIIMKVADASSNRDWYIWDDTRSNPIAKHLRPNINNAEAGEAGKIAFTSTGVSITTNDDELNANGKKTIYMVFADKREYAYWLDQSGNNNDWTSNNLTESDISVDSPTNNFATLNPLNATGNLAEGNLKGMPNDNRSIQATFSVPTGKWYWECLVSSGQPSIGIVDEKLATNENYVADASGCFYYFDGRVFLNNSTTSTGISYTSGDILSFTFDASNNQFKMYKNNSLVTTKTLTSDIIYTPSVGAGSANPPVYCNFGQDSSFAGNKTAQGNQDGNDIGDFYYTPPTGFLALCTKNLPDVAVTPSEHFNTVLYNGNGASTAITGVGFQPDFLWIKNRPNAFSHWIQDSVRGGAAYMFTDVNDAEAADYGASTTFDSDGFSIPFSSSYASNSSYNYVAWNWKANGSGSSNTDGSINTTATSANVDAGFSIVSYTGNGTAGATIGHGLSKTPDIVFVKRRNGTGNTLATMPILGNNYLQLTTNEATIAHAVFFNNTLPTATVFSVGTANDVNANTGTYIAYCFHSVDGYSKVGSYTGNGNADGTFVYTGFRPAFILLKQSTAAQDWQIYDVKRSTTNLIDDALYPNTSGAEATANYLNMDIVSNGFKLRIADGANNVNNGTYIYLCFAETPFKYSNAR